MYTQLPETEITDSEIGTNESEITELEKETDDKDVETPSSNNDVNSILIAIAIICGIGMIGMFGVVIFVIKKK